MRYVISRSTPGFGGLDSFFDDFFSDVSTRKYPPVDIYETEGAYTIELEVAGYGADDIKITVKDGVITIASAPSWKDRIRKRMEERKLIAGEISLPEFSRSFSLPEDSDAAAITADSTNGILTITIPKIRKTEPGRIEVRIGK